MNKLLNEFKVEKDNEHLTVQVIENETGIKINIDTNTPLSISVNGDVVEELFNQEEYKYIPPHIRPFISSSFQCDRETKKEGECKGGTCLNTDVIYLQDKDNLPIPLLTPKRIRCNKEIDRENRKVLCSYLEIGEEFMYDFLLVNIPINGSDLRIEIDLYEYEQIEIFKNVNIENGLEHFDRLINDLSKLGFKLNHICRNDGRYDSLYELIIPIDNFNKDDVREAVKLCYCYNSNLENSYLANKIYK